MISILYILDIIFALISTFVNLSKGAWFESNNIKGISAIIHWILLIVLIVLAIIYYSWIHLIIMVIVDLIVSWIFSYIIITYLYKGKI